MTLYLVTRKVKEDVKDAYVRRPKKILTSGRAIEVRFKDVCLMAVDRGTRRAISRTMSTSTTQDARAVRSARRNPSSKNAHKTCSSERSSGGEAENEMVCTLPNVLRVGRCDAVPPDGRRRQRACATTDDRRKESGPGGEEDARKQAEQAGRTQASNSEKDRCDPPAE